jgi:mannose-6-phosphate isomerase-like protein (cupin superfamily)
MTTIIQPANWLESPPRFQGEWQGGAFGSNICIIANRIEGKGGGPRLHIHPYAEVFVVREGHGLFTIGNEQVEAGAGQILVCPPDTPHKFENLGPGPLETIDIHEAGTFKTTWLE